MGRYPTATPYLPRRVTLASLAAAAQACRGCDLYAAATQTVFGEGPARADFILVGEVPGDREDLEGRPFVGPAGRLLAECLESAGIDREASYVTNAVKHFRWEPRGLRRLHKKPTWGQIEACRPWLLAEIAAIGPKVVICLGATAAQSLLGPKFRITKSRGQIVPSTAADERWPEGRPEILATYHPSAILRAPKPDDRARMRADFIRDLEVARKRAA
jgi:DNA polymerase